MPAIAATLRSLVCLLLSLATQYANAQRQNLKFDHLDINAGLSQNNVLCVLQDSRGFMWFGTRDGLNKYDGYKITVYRNDPRNPHSLSNNFISAIIEDTGGLKSGSIWVATRGGGLNRYDREKDQFTCYKKETVRANGISSNLLTGLAEDRDGNLWIGTEDQGLNFFEPAKDRFTHFTFQPDNPKSISGDYVRGILVDSRQNVWIGTYGNGLNLLDKNSGSFTRFRHDNRNDSSLGEDKIWVIYEDSRHQVWVGTDGGGLNLMNSVGPKGTFRHFRHEPRNKNSVAGDVIYTLGEDDNKHLWIGTENAGLSIYDQASGSFQNYLHDEIDNSSLSNNSLHSAYRDNNGNMWVGTFAGGMNILSKDGRRFTHYQHTTDGNSLSNNNILCLVQDSKKKIWIGTDGGGLDRFDPETKNFIHFRHDPNNPKSICGDYILCVCEDKKGALWIGSWANGITVFDPRNNTYRHFRHDPGNPNSISSNNAYAILQDRDENIWIGTYGGGLDLYHPKDGTFSHFSYDATNPASVNNKKIHSIFEGRQGEIWLGTDGGGLNLFDKKTRTFTQYIHKENENSLSDNRVGEIYEDEKGNLWVGTLVGLNFFDRGAGHFRTYTTDDGLPNNVIFGIIPDGKGNLWVSTNKGISLFNVKAGTFKNFEISDGLQSYEYKEHAYCKSSSGALYFGGVNGFNEFFPDSIKENPSEPPLRITGFQVFNKDVPIAADSTDPSPLKKSISETKEITLPYSSSVISFEFASLNYSSPEKKQYAFILEGFDKNWNYVESKRVATYTNLDPGHYIFAVRGLNYEGKWSPHGSSLRLTITPPFWLTWWFRLTIGLIIAGVCITAYRIRISHIKAQKKQLEDLVQERTKQLGQSIKDERIARLNEEKARQEAEQANRAKSVFLANMSHEIRTPMNGMIGMASLLEQTPLTDEQRGYTGTIQTCGETLLTVINDILDFSKIESGRMELDEKEMDLRRCIKEVLDIFSAKAADAGLSLYGQIDEKVPAIIIADEGRLRQILINLVGNAIKFTHQGGISVKAFVEGHPQTEIHPLRDKQTIEIGFEVRDTGIGIPPDKIDRLFKAFSQVDSSITRKYGGTGLGLVISEKLTELMGGRIDVKSEPGKGSLFSFTIRTRSGEPINLIPMENNLSGQTENKPVLPSHLAEKFPMRILVAEDNPINQQLTMMILSKMGYSPGIAENGLQVLDRLREFYFDLILMDIQMPEMDGLEATRVIRKTQDRQPIIIAMTANAMRGDQEECLAEGMDDYLSKPVNLEELVSMLEKWGEKIADQL
ncbi:two-component regulator propeller domain-containing protein [Flavitalea flava]